MKKEGVEKFLGDWERGIVPFSFNYNGVGFKELVKSWKTLESSERDAGGYKLKTISYSCPDTNLTLVCELKVFKEFPAIEWVLYFENKGKGDTPIIEDIQALDIKIERPGEGEFVLHRSNGSTCTANDFIPIDQLLAPNTRLDIAPNGGRSSDGNMPFFNLEWKDAGLVIAVGWSGQWQASFWRDAGTGLQVRAGMQKTHLKLRPGERIRTPRMLLVFWEGNDRMLGNNILRRLLLAHYVPKHNGRPIFPPVGLSSWFAYNTGNDVTEKNQIEFIKAIHPLGVEMYWLDAGWFEGGWPNSVGNWFPKKNAFPNGLKPLGDLCRKLGMKFIVWFEPERVNSESQIQKEHPDWVLHSEGKSWDPFCKTDGLFNLGNPEAREWLTDHISNMIKESGINVYRHDFNIDPLRFWIAADEEDRQGITEIKYIEGFYKFWDDLLERNPNIFIDNCASGGRRIDLETISRSIPLWHSDTQCCGYAVPEQDQAQNAGLNFWVPLHTGGVWNSDPYRWRSAATSGASLCTLDALKPKNFPETEFKKAMAELNQLRPLFLGDYYPLFDINVNDTCWCGYQFDRQDLGEGFALIFRRKNSPYPCAEIKLRGLKPAAKYEMRFKDTGKKKTGTGREFSKMSITIPKAPGSVLITYKRK